MITVKQIERAWNASQFERLYRDLVAYRPEAALPFEFDSGWSTPAAALALIRMDELCQSHLPLFSRLLRTVIAAQQADGGWGDVTTTALCLRALLTGNGHGPAVDSGLAFLANLQRPSGLWPQLPHHRLPEDPIASAAVLYHLASQLTFHEAVQIDRTIAWFEQNDSPLRAKWRHISSRWRLPQAA